jgi:hypothetical protein
MPYPQQSALASPPGSSPTSIGAQLSAMRANLAAVTNLLASRPSASDDALAPLSPLIGAPGLVETFVGETIDAPPDLTMIIYSVYVVNELASGHAEVTPTLRQGTDQLGLRFEYPAIAAQTGGTTRTYLWAPLAGPPRLTGNIAVTPLPSPLLVPPGGSATIEGLGVSGELPHWLYINRIEPEKVIFL